MSPAADVLNTETNGSAKRTGGLRMDNRSETSQDVTAIVGPMGNMRGTILLGIASEVASRLYAAMVGEHPGECDEMPGSALAELCNVITGQAAIRLAEGGRETRLTPPSIVTGKGTRLSTLSMPRLVIPITTTHGDLQIDIALSGD